MKLSVIIPVYKNIPAFIANLKHNMQFLKDCEIIIVNDDPSESLADKLKDVPQIKLIENRWNLGFGRTVNAGVQNASSELIMLLNSDVKLLNDSFYSARSQFNDKTVFAVTFAQKEKDNQTVGKNKIYWEKGFVQHSEATDLRTGITAWAEGGSCIIDKKKFDELKGFDPIYSPFYWEDIDLSFRAWKKGYKVLFDENIMVEHHHESTIGVHFSKSKIQHIAYRNQLLFIWKNISDPWLMMSHIFYLKIMFFKSLLRGDLAFIQGYFSALQKLPSVIKKRKELQVKLSDHEVFTKFY